ncbi:sensor domain-containing diguanylate cyclase [Niveibacterium sp. SC-1]|uniref:sensor domain-containing diguanylate cyclase n=1 Tax=Niveibacterium sp. SC-1 TaxID=3135646 RepID=UPI00311F6527
MDFAAHAMDPILDRLSGTLVTARNLEELTRPLLELVETITGLESTYLTMIDEARGVQNILYSRNVSSMTIPEGLSVPWNDTLCKRALDCGRPYTCDADIEWSDSDAARALGIVTYLSAPVRMGGNELYGTLCGASSTRHEVSVEAQRTLALFAKLIGDHLERERLVDQLVQANERLAHSAYIDQLTELPNRRGLQHDLDRLLAQGARSGTHALVAFVDLDGFKTLNDTYGHEIGDLFLKEVANRLRVTLRAGDLAGRLGGDEFVVAGAGPDRDQTTEEAARAFQQRVSQATVGEYRLGKARIDYQGASVGVVAAEPGARDASELIREADAAMYVVKRERKLGTQ